MKHYPDYKTGFDLGEEDFQLRWKAIVGRHEIPFPRKKGRRWRDYVRALRLEVSCGEAPYLTSRYDTTTGKWIDPRSRFFECVSKDLTDSFRNPQGLSVVNIRYCQRFYGLYSSLQNLPQLVEELVNVPWGQHRCIIDSCKGDAQKALFYMRMTLTKGWSRSELTDQLDANLYKSRDKMVVEYALSGSDRPIGVTQYKLHKVMPKELRIAAESIARLSAVVDETISSVKEGEGK